MMEFFILGFGLVVNKLFKTSECFQGALAKTAKMICFSSLLISVITQGLTTNALRKVVFPPSVGAV